MDTTKITRVEVINFLNHKGRVYSIGPLSNMKVEVSIQDDGRTLKLFIDKRVATDEPSVEDKRILGTSY